MRNYMKKLFLLAGVILCCMQFSCKKESANNAQIETLPIPLTTGTWWKYQRIDSTIIGTYSGNTIRTDSSIELITVIGKAPFSNAYYNINTVDAYLLQVKNITKGSVDTIHAFYDSTAFYIVPNKDSCYLNSTISLIDGKTQNVYSHFPYKGFGNVLNNVSISFLGKQFDHCIYNYDALVGGGNFHINRYLKTYLKPSVGYVYWEYKYEWYYYNDMILKCYYRRLLDFSIAP